MRPGTIDNSKAYRRVLATNSTMLTVAETTSVVTAPTTVTHPSLIDLYKGSTEFENFTLPRMLEFIPFGGGANNDELQVLHQALHPAVVEGTTVVQYVPVSLASVLAIKGATVGTSHTGGAVSTGDFIADTITIQTGTTDQAGNKNGPLSDRVGWYQVDVRGHRYITTVFASTANGKTGNALWRVV